MTRKHFKAIAEILSTVKNKNDKAKLVVEFCSYLSSQNSNFDSSRFKAACQTKGERDNV